MRRQIAELIWPYAVSVGTASLLSYAVPGCDKRICGELLNPAVNVLAIGVGFLGAMLGILLGSNYIKLLDSQEYRLRLISYLRQAIYLCFLGAIVSGLLLLLRLTNLDTTAHLLLTVWIALCGAAMLSSYRVIALLFHLLELQASE